MGSPVSNIVAEWKLKHIEEIIINEHKTKIRILWLRYVDNIFIITANHINLVNLLNKVKSYDKNIQFKIETVYRKRTA